MKNRYNIFFLLKDKKTEEEIFLYGISLPTNNDILDFDYKNEITFDSRKSDKFELVMFKNISNNFEFKESSINIENIFSNEKNRVNYNKDGFIKFNYKQEVIQTYNDVFNESPESIIKFPIKTDIYYNNDFFDYKNNLSQEEIIEILKFLENNTNLSFYKNENIYSKRLGCFEYVIGNNDNIINKEIENRDEMFKVDAKKINEEKEEFIFKKLIEYNKDLEIVLKIYDDLDSIIYYKKEIIKSNEIEKTISPEFYRSEVAGIEYEVFNNDGDLIDYYKVNFIKSISLDLFTLGSQIEYNVSGLTAEKGIYEGKNIKIDKSKTHKQEKNVVKPYNNNIWSNQYKLRKELYCHIKEYTKINNDNLSIFINNEDKEKIEKIEKFFSDIIYKNTIYEIKLYDPYFRVNYNEKDEKTKDSFDIFYKFLNEVNLKIYSSNVKQNKKENFNKEKIKKTQKILKQYGIIKEIKWFNFTTNNQFHDRYIIFKSKFRSNTKLFMLSNSLNSLFDKYPFCISELKGKIKEDILLYLENTLEKYDKEIII